MSGTVKLCDKINHLFNQRDNEQHIKSEDILEVSSLITSIDATDIIPDLLKRQLLLIIKDKLKSTNKELQKSTLTLLCQCFDLNLFTAELPLSEVLLVIIDEAFNKDIEILEEQELWLKALDALLIFADNALKPILIKRSTELLSTIKLALASHVISSPKKLKALKLLDNIVIETNLSESVIKLLLLIFHENLLPSMFDLSNKHLSITIDVSLHVISKIPLKEQIADSHWSKYTKNDITNNYLPIIIQLVSDDNDLFAQLWIFILKNLKTELHKNWSLVNSLLAVVEKAFKSQNMEIRKQAFLCWQALIDNFALSLNELTSPKRIKLLIIPLKTNNCKTEELIKVKLQTWCKLLNVMGNPALVKNIYDSGVLEIFLNFCFGPLGETPYMSYVHSNSMLAAPGKKFPNLYLEICENFAKIIGSKNRIKLLNTKTLYLKFDGPIITPEMFVKTSRLVIYAVGESSVLLSACTDVEAATKLNGLVWESLFELIDFAVENKKNMNVLDEFCAIVLNVILLSRKRPKLPNFCIKPLIKLIMSDKFNFCKLSYMDNKLYMQLLSTVFKKDNCSSSDMIDVFEYLFTYKRYKPEFSTFLEAFLEEMNMIINENCIIEKIDSIYSIWILIGNEIKSLLSKNVINNIKYDVTSVFIKFLIWGILHIHLASDQNSIVDYSQSIIKNYKSNSSCKDINSVANQLTVELLENENVRKSLSLITTSKFLRITITNLNLEKTENGIYSDLLAILHKFSNFISKPDLPNNCLEELQNGLSYIFLNCVNEDVLLNILPVLTDCLNHLLLKHQSTIIFNALKTFINNIKASEKLKPLLCKLLSPTKYSKIHNNVELFENFNTLLMMIQGKFGVALNDSSDENETHVQTEKEKKKKTNDEIVNNEDNKEAVNIISNNGTPISVKKKRNNTVKNNKNSNNEHTIISGVDIDTMKPVKVKGSLLNTLSETPVIKSPSSTPSKKPAQTKDDDEFIFVDSPYKFDPKKLTKSQKAKMGRRRDDIPALYQDLSQSQTQDFSNSCTETLSEDVNKMFVSDTVEEKETERPFSQITVNNENVEPTNTKEEPVVNNPEVDTPFVASAKKGRRKCSRTEYELDRIKMNNIVGFEEHLKNIDTSSISTRTRKKVLSIKLESFETAENQVKNRRTSARYKNLDNSLPVNDKTKKLNELPEIKVKTELTENVENSEDVTLKACKIPALYDLEKVKPGGQIIIKGATNTLDLVKGPKPSSPFKIKDVITTPKSSITSRRISLESLETVDKSNDNQTISVGKRKGKNKDENTTGKKKKISKVILQSTVEKDKNLTKSFINAESDEEMEMQQMENDEETTSKDTNTADLDTESIKSNMFDDNITTEYPNAVNTICRKVLFDNTDEESPPRVEETKAESPVQIITSPVRSDTPTRNKEFLNDTLEISPIKTCNGAKSKELIIDEVEKVIKDLPTVIIKSDNIPEKSPELFSTEQNIETTKEIIEPELSTPVLSKTVTRRSKLFLPGRGAQMMNLISPNNSNKVENVSTSSSNVIKTTEQKTTTMLFNRGSSRISKMMVQLDFKSDTAEPVVKTPVKNPAITDGDIFHFTKNLPSPTASPRFGILRKRKHPDHLDEGLSPCTKRKRVNFSDPPVSCRKFIEGRSKRPYNLKPRFLDITCDEELMRPSMNEADVTEEQAQINISEVEIVDTDNITEGFGDPSYNIKEVTDTNDEMEVITEPDYIEEPKEIETEETSTKNNTVEIEEASEKDMEVATNVEIETTPIIEEPIDTDETFCNLETKSDSNVTISAPIKNNVASNSDNYEIESNTTTEASPTIDIIETTVSAEIISNSISSHTETAKIDEVLNPVDKEQMETSINVISNSENANEDKKTDNIINKVNEKQLPTEITDKNKLFTCTNTLNTGINNINDKIIEILSSDTKKTVSDLSKLAEEKMPKDTEVDKTVLDTHNSEEHVLKPIRKIRPVTISSPVRKQKINKVPIIESAEKLASLQAKSSQIESEELFSISIAGVVPNRLCESPNEWSSSSSSPSPPLTPSNELWTSPGVARENILKTKVIGGKLEDVLCQIKNIFAEKKCDPKPILQEYVSGLDLHCSPSTFAGALRIHHVAANQKWDDIFSDIVAYIGIKKVVRYLTRLKSVPQDILVENLYKFISKDTNVFNMKNVISLFDTATMFQAIYELINQKESSDFRLAFEQCFVPLIIKSPDIGTSITSKLSIVQLGDEVIDRIMNDDENKETFLQKLYDKMDSKNSRLVSIKNLNGNNHKLNTINEFNEESLSTACLLEMLTKRVENGALNESHFDLLNKLFIKLPMDSTLQLFTKVIKTKYDNK